MKQKKYRVIAKSVVTVGLSPVIADSPQEAVDVASDKVDWYALFASRQGDGVTSTEYGEEFHGFIVDPIGEDGEPDCENAVWLEGDGETPVVLTHPGVEIYRIPIEEALDWGNAGNGSLRESLRDIAFRNSDLPQQEREFEEDGGDFWDKRWLKVVVEGSVFVVYYQERDTTKGEGHDA